MASRKLLDRNICPVRIADQEDDDISVVDEDGEGISGSSDTGSGSDEEDGSSDNDEEESEEELDDGIEGSEADGDDVEEYLSNVSFGALKQAQDALSSKKRKRSSDEPTDQEDKLEALRKRMKQIRDAKAAEAPLTATTKYPKQSSRPTDSTADSASDSGSAPSEVDAPSKSRTSKYAPRAQSTKHQVTRKRAAIALPKSTVRDPRFDAFHSTTSTLPPGTNTDKAYSFLRDYQKSEIAELKTAMRATKVDEDKVILRRKIVSMENRIKSQEAKEREQAVVSAHRKEERGRVEQGKQPYYLKTKEVKERALVERFKGMKGKEREKIVEKRRKKEGQKERKRMPEGRRMVG